MNTRNPDNAVLACTQPVRQHGPTDKALRTSHRACSRFRNSSTLILNESSFE